MHVFTIDVGGTAIKYATLNEMLEIRGKGQMPTPLVDYETFLDTITELVQKECRKSTAEDLSGDSPDLPEPVSESEAAREQNDARWQYGVESVSISLPGVIDSKNGRVLTGGTLYFNAGHNVASDLNARLGLPVYIENDAKCAILAEAWKGSLSDKEKIKNAAVLILGTGLGGGIMIDRRLYKGRNFSAGEFSFIKESVEMRETDSGTECQAGNICSATGLISLAKEETGAEELNGKAIFEAVNSGDPVMLRVLRRFAHRIALFIYNIHMFIDPDCIALGGGISRQDILLDYVREELQKIYSDKILLQFFPIAKPPEVVQCHFFNDANLVGAMYHYISSFYQE